MIKARYDKITTWADLFADSTIEAKKMIVSQLINQVRVGRDYAMEIDLTGSYEIFSGMLQENQTEEMKESARTNRRFPGGADRPKYEHFILG